MAFANIIKQLIKKKSGKSVSVWCSVGYKWVTIMDCVKFEFNVVKSLCTKNDSEQSLSVGL